jgi:glycosyltransferase involved in cell wall biosynthesis
MIDLMDSKMEAEMRDESKPAIGMIAFTYYKTDGRVRRFAEALVEKGYTVDVIALRESSAKPVYELNAVKIYQVPLTRKRGTILRYLFEYASFFLLGAWWMTRLFLKKRYKVIHVHNMPDFLVFTTFVPKLFGVKVILDIHDPLPELFATKFNFNRQGMGIKLLDFEEKVSFKFADYVMTVTDLVKSLLLRKGVDAQKIATIINAPDSRIFNLARIKNGPPESKKRFTLLFAGTVVERNGLANMVKALPELIPQIPNLCFRVIGDGDYVENLKQLVADLSLENYIEFCSPLPIEQIPQEIVKADAIAWFPERNDFIDLALSVKVMEALVMGRPVIGTKTKCHEYYFNEKELLFTNSTDTGEIAQGIFNLYQNYDTIKPSSADIQKFIAKFDWEIEKEKYLGIIKQLSNCAGKRNARRFE